jgi:hypothetical protein
MVRWYFYRHAPNLSLPNEDFGRRNKRCNPDFEGSTFQGREYSIWATNHWKVSRKSGLHLLFLLPKSSFGEHRITLYQVIDAPQTTIWEGRTNISERVSRGSTFQRFVAQIDYLCPWKMRHRETHSEMFVRPYQIVVWPRAVWRTKNGGISHPLLNEGSCIREHSAIRLISNRHWNDLKEMCPIDPIEYSRMHAPSLSRGCEIAPFFVRYIAYNDCHHVGYDVTE